MGKNVGRKISKNLSGKSAKTFLIMLTNLPQMRLKLLQKEQYKKTAEVVDDLIGNKEVIKLEKFKKFTTK